MNWKHTTLALLVAGGLVVGCDDGGDADDTLPDPAPSTTGVPHDHDGDGVADHAPGEHGESLTERAGEMAGEAADATAEAYEEVKEETKEAVEAGRRQVDEFREGFNSGSGGTTPTHATPPADMTPDAIPAPAAPDEPAAGAATGETDMELSDLEADTTLSTSQADGVIAKIKRLISEKNLTQAEQWLTKLEEVNLPAGYGEQVASLKNLLSQAKGASGVVPAVGK